MEKLGIVADDLTGAMDTSVQFARRGLPTVIPLVAGEVPPAEVVAISTDSRGEPAAQAYRRAREAAQQLSGRLLYKKVDSTVRGHLGVELDAVLDGLECERALVAPAFPSAGRTTVDGYHYVHGTLLAESAFARDPLWPARESHLPTLLARQTRRQVRHLPLAVVEQGERAVTGALQAEGACIIVADAVIPAHLRTLALALGRAKERWLPCGSAGLAEAWIEALGLARLAAASIPWGPVAAPVLVIAGSRHPSTARQLQRAAEGANLGRVDLDLDDRSDHLAAVFGHLRQGRSVALTTTFSEYRNGQEAATAQRLARAAVHILAGVPLAGLVLTGGDVARAVCTALGTKGLRIVGQVQDGVPAAVLMGGLGDGLRVVTKAGGLGDDQAILQSIALIQGG